MTRSSGSGTVRRRLGAALRSLRDEANIRIERAARELECSPAKISRLENGLAPAKTWEVRALLALYGVHDEARRAQFDEWAAATKAVGWWEPDSDVTEDDDQRYIAAETESSLLQMYCTPTLPVLLQTPEYNLAHVAGWRPDLDPADAARFAHLRMARRQELVERAGSLHLVAVVDEGAVRRQVGSAEIHVAQLAWLAGLLDDALRTQRDDLLVRIFPFTAGSPGRALSAFTIFTPRERSLDPLTAFVEDTDGGRWYDSTEDVQPLSTLFDDLLSRSLTPQDSLALLRSL